MGLREQRCWQGSEGTVFECGGSVPVDAGGGTSAWAVVAGVRQPVYEGQAGDLQLPCVCFADSQVDVPADKSRQLPCARVQGKREYQYSVGAGDFESDRPVRPGDRCDRSGAASSGDGGAYKGVAERSDYRERELCACERDRQQGDSRVEVAAVDWRWTKRSPTLDGGWGFSL